LSQSSFKTITGALALRAASSAALSYGRFLIVILARLHFGEGLEAFLISEAPDQGLCASRPDLPCFWY
jgi:hypothetical protein